MNDDKIKNIKIATLAVGIFTLFLFFMPFITLRLGDGLVKNYNGFEIAFNFDNSLLLHDMSDNVASMGLGFFVAFAPLLYCLPSIVWPIIMLVKPGDNRKEKDLSSSKTSRGVLTVLSYAIVILLIIFSKSLLGIADIKAYELGYGAYAIIVAMIALCILELVFAKLLKPKNEQSSTNNN